MKRNKIIALVFIFFLIAIFFCVKFFDKNISNANNSKNANVNKTLVPIDAPAKDLRGEAFRQNVYKNNPIMFKHSWQFKSSETCDDNKLQEKFLDAIITNDLKNVKKYLNDGADIEGVNISGATPLMLAAFHGNIDVANFLIEKGANINFRHLPDNTSVLSVAIRGGNSTIAKNIIKKGADLDLKIGGKDFYLSGYSLFVGDLELIKMLIEKGGIISDEPVGALFSALSFSNYENNKDLLKIIQIVIDSGADVNLAEGTPKITPLMVAIKYNKLEVVKILLANGADKTKKDNLGKTALDIAKEKGNKEIIELLENK